MNTSSTNDRHLLLGTRFSCECGAVHEVPVREAVIEAGAISRVAEVMQRQGISGPVLLLSDEITHHVAGERVASVLGAAGIRVHAHVLPGRPKAEYTLAEEIAVAVPSETATVVSCGSGTVTDLGKWAAFRRSLPQIAVATAPSMNGYASGIAALTRDGLKATTPITPAVAVIADLDVLTNAPMEMIRAGLGDILSKPVCNADWKIASLIRGERFCIKPFELIRDLEEIYIGRAHFLEKRDPQAIAALTEALVFAGVSMVIAGSSQPASGAEHLIAHFLDMRSAVDGREPDLHGVTVGIGTIASAALYEEFMRTDADSIESSAIEGVWERGDAALARCSELLPHAADAIEKAFAKKRGNRASALAEAGKILGAWAEMKDAARPFLKPASEIEHILRSAGAKTSPSQIGVSRETFLDALMLSFCVRDRFTILDVAFAAGMLDKYASQSMGIFQ